MPRQKSTHVDSPEAVGLRLRAARDRAGLSQRQLAFSGCTPAYISRIESGDRIPSLQLLRELGRRLGVTAEYLATGAEGSERDLLLEAELALRIGDSELAEGLLGAELADAVESARRARVLGGLGELAYRSGDVGPGLEQLADSAALLGDALVDHPTIAVALGAAYDERGNREGAVGVYERMVELARARGNTPTEVRFSVLLANTLVELGNLGRAEELLRRAIGTAAAAGDPQALARLYWSQSQLQAAERSFEVATSYARRALALLDLADDRHSAARAHQLLARVELERGNAGEALQILARGRPLLESADERVSLALFRLEEARALLQLGRGDEARSLALELLPQLDGASGPDAGRAYPIVADILSEAGDREQAIEVYESALERLDGTRFALEAYKRLAELLDAEGRQAEALAVLKKALAVQDGVSTQVE